MILCLHLDSVSVGSKILHWKSRDQAQIILSLYNSGSHADSHINLFLFQWVSKLREILDWSSLSLQVCLLTCFNMFGFNLEQCCKSNGAMWPGLARAPVDCVPPTLGCRQRERSALPSVLFSSILPCYHLGNLKVSGSQFPHLWNRRTVIIIS